MKHKPFNKRQEDFIKENFRSFTDIQLANKFEVNEWTVTQFRMANNLLKNKPVTPRKEKYKSDIFSVMERENWLV